MRTINIPFHSDMVEAIIKGHKTATTRTKRYGIEGDTFIVAPNGQGVACQLIAVRHLTLEQVAFQWHREEGFNSVEGFIKRWEQIHPKAGYKALQKVWLHQFKIIYPFKGKDFNV